MQSLQFSPLALSPDRRLTARTVVSATDRATSSLGASISARGGHSGSRQLQPRSLPPCRVAAVDAESSTASLDGRDALRFDGVGSGHGGFGVHQGETGRLELLQQQSGGALHGADLVAPQRSAVVEEEWHESDGWRPRPHHKAKAQLWAAIVSEAREDAAEEPALASFLHTSIIMHKSMEKGMAFLLANKLSSPTLLGTQLTRLFLEAYADDETMAEAAVADIQAVFDRDPACLKYSQCLLYFKGFQAIQCHRVAHWMWRRGRKALAIALQSRISEVFHVDIHPAARLGRGLLMDHATGVVIGETAVVGDNVVLLHQVTLGGSGMGKGVRHPNIGNGVLLGAGVCVLGPVSLGRGSKVGARSVVVNSLPPHCVAVGVPARVVKQDERSEPVMNMDMISDFIVDYII